MCPTWLNPLFLMQLGHMADCAFFLWIYNKAVMQKGIAVLQNLFFNYFNEIGGLIYG